MADPNKIPALPSTVDKDPYVPLSWMAVAAATVSIAFFGLLVTLTIMSFWEHKPLLESKLLYFLPLIGVVLSFAARRMIRNSEGTRTGEQLVNKAWWISVVGGLAYVAYMLAIDVAIRRDTESEVEQWVGLIIKDRADDPTHASLNQAFISTLDPARRRNLSGSNSGRLEAAFRDNYLAFNQTDLVRMIARNGGDSEFVRGGVRDWNRLPNGLECVVAGKLRCPEGEFALNLSLKGVDPEAGSESVGREWIFMVPASGYFIPDECTRTAYGWLLDSLEQSGLGFGSRFFKEFGFGPYFYSYAYHKLIGPESKRAFWAELGLNSPVRIAVAGGPMEIAPFVTPEYTKFFRDDFFKLPGGAEPSVEQKNLFKRSWETLGIATPGSRLKNSPDKHSLMRITDTAIEVRLPGELPVPGQEGKAARCKLVVVCNDPSVLAEVKRLRSEANPKESTLTPPMTLQNKDYQWRIARLETDMIPISSAPSRTGGSPGGPPAGAGQ